MLRSALFCSAIVLSPVTAFAQVQGLEKEMTAFFVAYCAGALDNFISVRGAAKIFDWMPLSADQLNAGAPLDPSAELEGWLAIKKTGSKFLLALSTTKHGTGCSVANLESKPNLVIEELNRQAKLSDHTDEKTLGQREQSWVTELHGNPILIRFITSLNENELGGSLQAATIGRN